MKRKTGLIFIIWTFLVLVFPLNISGGVVNSNVDAGFSGLSSTVDSWPLFHHDLTHSGGSNSKAPNPNATLWNFTTSGEVNDPVVVNGVVFIGAYDDKVYALKAANGALIWSYTTGGVVVSSPAVVDGVVYLGSWDHKVYAFGSLPIGHFSAISDLIVPVLAGVSIAVSAIGAYILLAFFIRKRKKKRQLVNYATNENPMKPKLKGIPIAKVRVVGDPLRFFVVKGFHKKQWVAVMKIPIYEVIVIENFGNEISTKWKGVSHRFLMKKNAVPLGEFRNEAKGILEKEQSSSENRGKAVQRRKELLVLINASVGIIDFSFDVLIGLMKEKRINWQQLESYSNGFRENLRIIGETMPSLSLDFSKVTLAIKRRVPKETSNEVYNILKTLFDYFSILSLDDDLKQSVPNFQKGKDIILGYFMLNDLLLGKAVGNSESKEEISQLETVLQILANEINLTVNFGELKCIIGTWVLENNGEKVIQESRGIFKRQLKQSIY